MTPHPAPAAPATSRLHPRSWPITLKLGIALVLSAVLPMVVVGYINLRSSLDQVEAMEFRNLEQLGATTAGRLDQFIVDSRHQLSYFAWSEEVIRIADTVSDGARLKALDKMNRLLTSNANVELLMVMDAKGIVVAATKPEYLGRDLSFREYFTESIAGREFLSHLEIGSASGKPGLYLAAPVRSPNGLIGGVAVMKMRGQAVTDIVAAARSEARTAFLLDDDGVIINHPDPRAMHRSLMPLPPELQKEIAADKRFGDITVTSLDMAELAQAIRNSRGTGHGMYLSPFDRQEKIAAFARLQSHTWVVVISENRSEFAKPLYHLYDNALNATLIVGLLFSVISLVFAQGFLRPIRRLTESARAVREGDYDRATLPEAAPGGDELGELALTFNTMVAGIKERERERDIFGRVVSPEVREKLLAGDIALGGENRRVTVLFSDIRDFSTISEKLSPQDVVALLNDYLTEMAEAIRPWGGNINNFIGDAIVVVFGAPESRAEIEWSAVGAALDMKARLEALNLRRQAIGDIALKTGIGISTGKVVAGQVGSLERFLYTVIGDAVNVAARLEAMTKEVDGNPILINAATYEGIRHREGLHVEDLGARPVKGRGEPVHVYGVFGA